jgi:hypothetical protein
MLGRGLDSVGLTTSAGDSSCEYDNETSGSIKVSEFLN